MGASCIECLLFHARGRIERRCSGEVEIGRNDNVEGREEASQVLLVAYIAGIDSDGDARIEPLDLWSGSFGAVFAYVSFLNEKLRGQIVFSDDLMIDYSEFSNSGEDQVLCDFVCEGLDADEEDVGFADAVGRQYFDMRIVTELST